MSLRINSNPAAVNAYRNLTSTNVGLGKSLEKLSSGFRINRAADDAAGLVKSETLRAEISGNKAAIRNAQDGISFVQTAEGALNEVHSILQRMRELAVDAANPATTDGTAQQAEIDELATELEVAGKNGEIGTAAALFTQLDAAVKEFGRRPGDFVAVLLDMTMPEMTGEKLARELISIRPDIPIILCTGFNEQINEQKAKAIGIKAFLMKPLTVNQLAKTVRAVLGKKSADK